MNDRTVGLGACGAIFDRTGWRPWHYVGTSSFIKYERYKEGIMEAIRESRDVWLCKNYKEYVDRPDVNWLNCLHAGERTYTPLDVWWSGDPTQWVSKYGSSAFAALQIMVWYGYDEIYLYGMDGYGEWKNHYAGYPENPQFTYAHYNLTRVAAFKLAKRMMDQLGVECFTIGNTDLDFFPSVEWKDIDRLD
jgi:hypothetical protein